MQKQIKKRPWSLHASMYGTCLACSAFYFACLFSHLDCDCSSCSWYTHMNFSYWYLVTGKPWAPQIGVLNGANFLYMQLKLSETYIVSLKFNCFYFRSSLGSKTCELATRSSASCSWSEARWHNYQVRNSYVNPTQWPWSKLYPSFETSNCISSLPYLRVQTVSKKTSEIVHVQFNFKFGLKCQITMIFGIMKDEALW